MLVLHVSIVHGTGHSGDHIVNTVLTGKASSEAKAKGIDEIQNSNTESAITEKCMQH